MGAVVLFLVLIPGGLLYNDHMDRKILACQKRGESFCEYRMKPLNSPRRKKYLESIQGQIDPILECEVWTQYDPEYASSICPTD